MNGKKVKDMDISVHKSIYVYMYIHIYIYDGDGACNPSRPKHDKATGSYLQAFGQLSYIRPKNTPKPYLANLAFDFLLKGKVKEDELDTDCHYLWSLKGISIYYV